MSGTLITGSTGGVAKAGGATAVEAPNATPRTNTVDATDLLPPPMFASAPTDDFATTLALMTLQQKHEDRVQNDAQARAATQAQEKAQAEKIEKMHELADDTFAEGLVDGIAQGATAAASGLAACVKFTGECDVLKNDKLAGERLIRNASLIDAGGGAMKAGGTFIGTMFKRDQELDRADMAVADQAIERAKGTADSTTTQARRDEDDIRDTVGSIRSLANAKTQLAQSAIMRA